jgi:uncharacterized protein YbaP (TraB family)
MKKLILCGLLVMAAMATLAQKGTKKAPPRKAAAGTPNTLLWRVTGKGLEKPSYLFGTMHLLCANDIVLSDSLSGAISRADNVYLELDLSNMMEMMSVMAKMKMRNDTTLADLVTKEEYETVKARFSKKGSMVPFSMVETYKPLIAASLLMEQSAACENMISMEQLIMAEARTHNIKIKGLETMAYQVSIFDSIPYRFQARQLVKMVSEEKKGAGGEMVKLTNAYRQQQLDTLERLTREGDDGIQQFTELLLYRRNQNWVNQLAELMPGRSLVVAVGAGHLPGSRGVIELLRKAGYSVEPVRNEMIKKKTKTI